MRSFNERISRKEISAEKGRLFSQLSWCKYIGFCIRCFFFLFYLTRFIWNKIQHFSIRKPRQLRLDWCRITYIFILSFDQVHLPSHQYTLWKLLFPFSIKHQLYVMLTAPTNSNWHGSKFMVTSVNMSQCINLMIVSLITNTRKQATWNLKNFRMKMLEDIYV